MATGPELADEYSALMAQVIAAAGGCSDEEWGRQCQNEQRPVGVMFDHLAAGNTLALEWIDTFLAGRPVTMTRDENDANNAAHAERALGRPRHETMAALRDTTHQLDARLRGLEADQLRSRQSFSAAGEQDLEWVAGVAMRHPRVHLESIRTALGR